MRPQRFSIQAFQGIEEEFDATVTDGTLGLSLFVIAYGIGPLIVSIKI